MWVHLFTFEVAVHILLLVYILQTIKCCESEKDLRVLETVLIELKWREAVRWQTAEEKSEKILHAASLVKPFRKMFNC